MTAEQKLFLQALGCALRGVQLSEKPEILSRQWEQVFRLARRHRVLPMIFQAVYTQESLRNTPLLASLRGMARQEVYRQAGKTAEFLEVYRGLRAAGVDAMVVKGILCRKLYPNPDQRPSGDEDLLIPPEQLETAHGVLTKWGMTTESAPEDYEITYIQPEKNLRLEVHSSLFPPDSGAYGHLNGLFENIHSRAVEETVEDVRILSPSPTDHLLYLICHAFKHFLHSGFGIRQICDIGLYAARYENQIDWVRLMESCRGIRADRFAAGVFRIARVHLGVETGWEAPEVDEIPLLEDLLDAGLYGNEDKERLHAASITLSAVQGKGGGLKASLFPPAGSLAGRYPYLKKYPLLLPVAWVTRLVRYGTERSSAAGSIRIGAHRVELMKCYGILDE